MYACVGRYWSCRFSLSIFIKFHKKKISGDSLVMRSRRKLGIETKIYGFDALNCKTKIKLNVHKERTNERTHIDAIRFLACANIFGHFLMHYLKCILFILISLIPISVRVCSYGLSEIVVAIAVIAWRAKIIIKRNILLLCLFVFKH